MALRLTSVPSDVSPSIDGGLVLRPLAALIDDRPPLYMDYDGNTLIVARLYLALITDGTLEYHYLRLPDASPVRRLADTCIVALIDKGRPMFKPLLGDSRGSLYRATALVLIAGWLYKLSS